MREKNSGITLIALVITIVILIILAGVAINLSLGDNGIFNKAQNAKGLYTNGAEKEKEEINNIDNDIEDQLSDELVRAIKSNITISRGTNQNVSEYFKIKTTEEIESIKYYNVTQEEVEIENTKELLTGEYTIKCVVTKKDKTEESATIKLTVEGIIYIEGTVNVDEYLDEEVIIRGRTDDATVITANTYYFLPNNNIIFENVVVSANAISVNTANLTIKFIDCKFNLTGTSSSNVKAGIICNKGADRKQCIF